MTVLIKRYNARREVVTIDKYIDVEEIRLQPAGLIELKGKAIVGEVVYLRYFAHDPMDIIIMDKEPNAEPK
jgi:hypothetical protein